MKHLITITLFVLVQTSLFSQFLKKDDVYLKYSIDTYIGFYFSEEVLDLQTKEKVYLHGGMLKPNISYYFYKNLGVGLLYSYQYNYISFYSDSKDFIEFGGFLKYVLPYTIPKPFLNRFHVYIEPGFYKTNYLVMDNDIDTITYKNYTLKINYKTSDTCKYSKISVPIGLQYKINKNIYLKLNYTYSHFIKGKTNNWFAIGFGYKFLQNE